MTRPFPLTAALLALTLGCSYGEADKFRVIWNKTPESCATIGWCQVDGDPVGVRFIELDSQREGVGEIAERGLDHVTSHLDIDSYFVRLTGLKPDTLYQFQVLDSNHENDALTFRTAPAGAGEFSFVAGGDSRNHRDARQRANRTVALLQPLFVCFGGDMINRSSEGEWRDWLDDWQLTRSSDGHMVPIIAARGNHEGKHDIHAFFDTPNPDDYYAVQFGGDYLRVYTLNSNITRAGSQGQWLAQDLAANEGSHWKIAHYHHPFYPHQSGKREQHAQYNAWAPLFFKHGVELAVECDSHVVKRTWPLRPSTEPGSEMGFIRDDQNGTTFIGEGCWGAPLRANDDDKVWTRASGSFNQVNWIQVTPEKLTTRTVKVDSIDDVTGAIDPADPFKIPEGLEIWEPESGAAVTVLPLGDREIPIITARLKLIATEDQATGGTAVRMERAGGRVGEDYQIRYTLDGGEPVATSDLYTRPVPVGAAVRVRAALFRGAEIVTEPVEIEIGGE